ncbi:MAG: hypothetical protein V7607_4954 [Solirubrobacteraceae bacterium]
MGRPAIVAVVLAAILVVGGGLRLRESVAHRVRAVADEQAYVAAGAAGWALYACSGRSAGYSPRKRSRASA